MSFQEKAGYSSIPISKSFSQEVWRPVSWSTKYEVSSLARVRIRTTKKLLIPSPHTQQTAYYQIILEGKKIWVSARQMYNEAFSESPAPHGYFDAEWAECIKIEIHIERNLPQNGNRSCHTCGHPTDNYWCDLCRFRRELNADPLDPDLDLVATLRL